MNTPTARVRGALLLGALALLVSLGSASPSYATTAQFCNYSAGPGVLCPDFPQGERHTYHTATADTPSCQLPSLYLYVAYASSNAGSPKYTYPGGTCTAYGQFYNNNELLRPYGTHNTQGFYQILGTATY